MEHLPTQIAAAANMSGLYPAKHPRVVLSVEKVVAALDRTLDETGQSAVTYVLIGDDLVIGDRVIRKSTLGVRNFIGILEHRGIERLTMTAGLDAEEANRFIAALTSGDPIPSTPHIVVGRAHLALEEEAKRREQGHLSVQQVEVVRDAWARFRVERNLPVDQLEALVWSLIDSVSGSTRSMLPLAPLRDHDEYTFVHSINVSILVLLQARSFGIYGPMLHDFGMAGLLHDIGKLTVPAEILQKTGRLEAAEWEVMKNHAQEGAWHLAELDGSPPLAAIVAYEHHLRHDGQPNYPLLHGPRELNLASRMTAIADTYDAMSTTRPHQSALGQAAALESIKLRSGTFFDPGLVRNFLRLMEEANLHRGRGPVQGH
ncbi:MAG: HD domain-containing phosphohydrolase [Thermoanaerobaculia bacterium]